MPATVINTLLLILGVPAIAGMWRTLAKTNKTLDRLTTAVTGFEGQGGALSEIVRLRERTHRLESQVTGLMLHTGLVRRVED
jgi:hypothetical protein